jgi:hypothetical protein
VLLPLFTLPALAGFVLPSAEWGAGQGTVYDNIFNYSGPFMCTLTPSVNTCTKSISSNQSGPPGNIGSASGTVSASTDAKGIHLYAESGVSGQANNDITGSASIYDTVYNNTGTAKQVQFTFHLDATLYSLSSVVDLLNVTFNNGSLFQAQLGPGGAGTYDFINQDFTTPVLTVAANSYINWNLVLSTEVTASSSSGLQYLAGLPTGYTDAGNTLSFTGISVFDAQGSPTGNSGLTSYAGFDYSTSSTSVSTAPEPATMGLCMSAGFGLLLIGRQRRRRSSLPSRSHPNTGFTQV